MILNIRQGDKSFIADLSSPIDISISLDTVKQPNCFHAPPFSFEPVRMGDFVGSVKEGGPVNFMNIKLNPHGNGTHTECIGHISDLPVTINSTLRRFHFMARLITVSTSRIGKDEVVQWSDLNIPNDGLQTEAIIIRTAPNEESKKSRNYTGSNPPYFHPEVMEKLTEAGIVHLLTDLPSVDREEDEGKLSSHKAFWNYPEDPRMENTITEMVYVADEVKDGLYLLNLQITSMELDASPSKPVIYPVESD